MAKGEIKKCPGSDALAASLLTMDEEVAQRYIEQIAGMNALEKTGDTAVLNIARAQLNGMINATILKDGAGGIAKKKLVEQMAKSGIGTKKYITDMLNTLDKFKTAVDNGDGVQSLYNILETSKTEGEAIFNDAVDKLYQHFSNKYALNDTYKVLDDAISKLDNGKATKEAEGKLIDTTYDILTSKGLVNENNIVDFVNKTGDKIKELKNEKKEYIRKNKIKAGKSDEHLDELDLKIKRYENIVKKSKNSDMYKGIKDKKGVASGDLFSSAAVEYTDGVFNSTSKDVIENYEADPKVRAEKIKQLIKTKGELVNPDATYIAMRKVLGDEQAYNNYVVARVLLSEGNDVVSDVIKGIGLAPMFGNKLKKTDIAKIKTMEDLVSVAFSYTKDLIDNPKLLKEFLKQKDFILGDIDSVEKLGVVNALYNIGYYGDNYATHIKYDIFAGRINSMGYELPKGMTSQSAYQKIGKAIIDNVNFKMGKGGKVQFTEWKKLTLEGKDGEKVVISGDDLRRLMPAFLPANAPFSNFKDVIAIAGYDDYLNKLESAVKETKKTAINEYDDIAQSIKGEGKEVVEEVVEESIFDQDKLEALRQMYEKMISDPKADDRSAIFLKALTKQTIDTKKTLLLSSSFDNAKDTAENQVKADLYNGLAEQNSIPVTKGIKGYKPSDTITEDLAKNTEFILIEGGYIDDGMWNFINNINKIREANGLAPATEVRNRMYSKGRFYVKDGELRFSIITSADYDDFINDMLSLGLDFPKNEDVDIPKLLKMYADYVDAAYGGKDANAQLKKISNLLGLPGKTDSKGKIITNKDGDMAVDVVELDQFVKDVTGTTGKFKAEVVDLATKWEEIKDISENGLKDVVNTFAREVGLPGVGDIKGVDVDKARELLFASMYNTNIVEAIRAKYALLKLFGITGVARETDKVAAINYLFNKQLRLSGYNMGVLQSDTFIRKLIDGEDISDDMWVNFFIEANKGNPAFKMLDGKEGIDKFNTLLANTKDTINFEGLKKQLSFPSDIEGGVKNMPHEGEQAVYRMLANASNGKTDGLLGSLEKIGLYLGSSNGIKNAVAEEMNIVFDVINQYKKAMQDLASNGGTYQKALELKQELQFVLSTINNKLIIPTYKDVVSDDMIKQIARLGVDGIPLNVSDTEQGIENFIKGIEDVENKYRSLGGEVRKGKEKISKMSAEERMENAIENGNVTIVGDDGGFTTIELSEVISAYKRDILDSGLTFTDEVSNLLSLTDEEIKRLSNKQKYSVFKKLALLKKYKDYQSMYKTVYYRLHTLLASSDFFNKYRLADNGYPAIINGLRSRLITDAPISDVDMQRMAQDIYDSLMASSFTEGVKLKTSEKMKFGSNFESPTIELISEVIKENVDNLKGITDKQRGRIQKYMEAIFNPYSELKSLSSDCETVIKSMLGKELDDFALSLGFNKERALEELGDLIISTDNGVPVTVSDMFNMRDTQEMLPNYIRDGNNQKVSISRLTGGEDVNEVNKEVSRVKDIVSSEVNTFNLVTELDKAVAKDTWGGVSGLFRQNTLLNQIARAEDRLFTEGTEIASLLRDRVFNQSSLGIFKKRWLAEMFPRFAGNKLREAYIEEVWVGIKEAYNRYYNMSLNELEKADFNSITDDLEGIGLRLALYFRRLGDMLGSPNGLKGVTTDMDINKALYNIGECINFINSSAGVLSMTSGLNGFQILKFVKVIKDGDGFHPFLRKISQASTGVSKKTGEEIGDETTRALLGTGLEASDINRFNELFNGDYSVTDAQRIIFALGGFQRDGWWNRNIGNKLKWLSKSSFFTRFFSSYPYGIVPIPLQQVGYSVKQYGITKGLGVSASDMNEFHLLRKRDNVLVGGYFEMTDAFSPQTREAIEAKIKEVYGSVDNFMNSIGKQFSDLGELGLVDEMSKLGGVLKGDDADTFWAKTKKVFNNPEFTKLFENSKENANNLVDGFNASTMKDLAFAQAVLRNNVYKFYSPEDYYLFMRDPSIDSSFKRRVKDEIIIQANRSFIDMMGIAGGATRAQVMGSQFGDIMMDLYNFINFRGQWGTTILRNVVSRFKQMFGLGGYIMKNIGKQGLADEVTDWLMRTPEMQNFLQDIFSVGYWYVHAQREATRGYNREDESGIQLTTLDQYNMLNQLAMFLQGLSSGGVGRILSSGAESLVYIGNREDTTLTETIGSAGLSMLEAFVQNFGRQFKFEKFLSDGLMVAIEQAGNEEFAIYEYFWNELLKLSKGSLRYMANESGSYDNYSNLENSTGPRWYIAGANTNKENFFLSQEDTLSTVRAIKEGLSRIGQDDKEGIDIAGILGDISKQSTLYKVCENLKNAANATYYQLEGSAESKVALSEMSKNVADINQFAGAVESTAQGKEMLEKGYYTPQDTQGYENLFKKFTSLYAPGASKWESRITDKANGIEIEYVANGEALFYDMIGEDGIKRIAEKAKEINLVKDYSAMEKRRRIMLATIEEAEQHADEPLYPEVASWIKRGVDMYRFDVYKKEKYEEYKAEVNRGITKKKDYKHVSEDDWYLGWEYALKQEFVKQNNLDWAKSDTNTYKTAFFQDIVRTNKDLFSQYVQSEKGYDEEGKEIIEYSIKNKYRKNYDAMSKAFSEIKDGNYNDAITTLSLIVRSSEYDDPSGVVGAMKMRDIMQFINGLSNYTIAEKANMKFKLLDNNYSIVRKIEDFKEAFGKDSYIVDLVADMRFDVDQSLTQAIQECSQSYEAGNTKKSGGSSGLSSLKSSKIKLDNLAGSSRGSSGSGNGSGRGRPTFNYSIDRVYGSEFLRRINQKKKGTRSINSSIDTYKEVPIVTEPKDLGKPKKIKGTKKKVKNK